jgi:hypothetical protein
MRKNISGVIRVIAFLMFVLGTIMFVVGMIKGADAGRGYYTRDTTAQFIWYACAAYSFSILVSSFFVLGFSYIVDAACKYLERSESEEEEKAEE